MDKIINTVVFKPNEFRAVVQDTIYQWDRDQVLRIEGLQLDPYVQIQFKIDDFNNNTTDAIGITEGGVTEVDIPAAVLQKYTMCDYKVLAYIYEGNETTHEILINITARQRPEDYKDSTEVSALVKAIDLLNQSSADIVTKAEEVTKQAVSVESNTQAVKELKGQIDLTANQVVVNKNEVDADALKVDTDRKAVAADKTEITQMKNEVDAIYQKHLDYGLKRLIFSDTEPEGDPREIIWVDTSDNTGL